MSERTSDEKWRQLMRKALADEGRRVRAKHPGREPTPQCPPLPLFLSRHRGGEWEPRYLEHFATGCPYCQRLQQLAAGQEEQLSAGTFDPDADPLPDLEPEGWVRRAAMASAVRGLSQRIAEQLKAVHASFHFRAGEHLLIAPREMCHNCRLEFDLVTDLRAQGLTSEMFGRPGVYNLSGEAIRAKAAKNNKPKPSLFTPVYGQECSALLGMPFYVEGQLAGLVKVENKQDLPAGRFDPTDRPFRVEDEELLRRSLDASGPVLAAALRWVQDHYPNPSVHISQKFNDAAA